MLFRSRLLDDNAKLLDSIKNTTDTIGVQHKTQITAFESAAQRKMEQIETAVKDAQNQLQILQSSISQQISALANVHAVQAIQINEGLSTIGLQIKSLVHGNQQSDVKFMRLLIAGLVGSTAMIGLAVAILQRH